MPLSETLDYAATKAFLVYIACTNMFDKKEASKLEGRELLMLLLKMLLGKTPPSLKRKETRT